MKSLKNIIYLFLAGIFLMGLGPTYSEAQPPVIPPGNRRPSTPLQQSCIKDPSIIFTEEQAQKLENLGRDFLEETKPLRDEMMDLRIALRFAFSDPHAQSQVLLDKQKRMIAVQAELQNLLFSYQLKIRSIFTRDQLERMPPDCPFKMGKGYEAGESFGKGLPKGIRR
jgi:hypothetical protein